MRRLCMALLACCALSAPARADDSSQPSVYYVPPTQLNAEMQIMSQGFSRMFGLFQNGTASFLFDESAKSISRLRLALDTTSIAANNPANQRDLAMLLDTDNYPEISLTAPDGAAFKDGKTELKGNVTMHGVSKPITIEATLNHVGKSPQGGRMWNGQGDAAGISLHATLPRADFGMGDDPNADQPSPYGKDISLTIDMQALKQ